MKRERRKFSAAFKAEVALELYPPIFKPVLLNTRLCLTCMKRPANPKIPAALTTTTAAGIDEACPQGCRRPLLRGEEATLGATAARKQPARQPRTSPESPRPPKTQKTTLKKCIIYQAFLCKGFPGATGHLDLQKCKQVRKKQLPKWVQNHRQTPIFYCLCVGRVFTEFTQG